MNDIRFRINLLLMLCVPQQYLVATRSIHRPLDHKKPEIITFWSDEKNDIPALLPGKKKIKQKKSAQCQVSKIPENHYILRSYYLAEWSIFGRYNKEFLEKNKLPEKIDYHYDPTKSIESKIIETTIEDFIQELFVTRKQPTKDFKNFTILKDRNFNYSLNAGMIIVKFKAYPFVLKLFIEKPETFTKPFSKGLENGFFFTMGDGMTRYLAGFTRIPNLISIQEKINADPYWKKRIVLPRKWYWTPPNVRTFTVLGKNIGQKEKQLIEFPSIYAIICDEIKIKRQLHTYHRNDRAIVKEITELLGNRIDPHVHNFFVTEETTAAGEDGEKIAIIDTEHLASIVGLHEPIAFHNNTYWYCNLIKKCTGNALFETKKMRRNKQKKQLSNNLIL